ncbi:MAG: hypothetical protein JSV17_05375 [Candidatus Aminicenantes bacterium]|nr:MAG: hypothetical protein JSV17_05375 [Candidatus Aminicenantes bacterium]
MKKIMKSWTFRIALFLFMASALSYTIHYFIFHDAHHIFIYMIGDFGFLFLDVLLVLLIIERLLASREKKSILHKLNMVIGTFFSEVGMELLHRFSDFVENADQLESEVLINPQWDNKNFQEAQSKAISFKYSIVFDVERLEKLRDFLKSKHSFLVRLLENPILLDNQRFTDLLWAVFHLSEELNFRDSLQNLPDTDIAHLKTDLRRAYSRIVSEWIVYTEHLKSRYPFLFSLAARINPLNPNASPIVQK